MRGIGRGRPGRCVRAAAFFLVPLCAPVATSIACTTVSVRSAPDEVRVERHFGVAQVSLAPSTDAVVAEVRSWGISSLPLGFTAGYARQSIAALPARCRLVLWVENDAQLSTVDALLGDVKDVCAITAP